MLSLPEYLSVHFCAYYNIRLLPQPILVSVPTSSLLYSNLIFLSEIIVFTAGHGFSTSGTTTSIYSSHHPARSLYRSRRGTLRYTRDPKGESRMGRLASLAGLGKGDFLDIFIAALIPRHFKALIFGMAIAIIAGTALGALGYPTPLIDPSLELVATSYKETVTRKVRFMIRARFCLFSCF